MQAAAAHRATAALLGGAIPEPREICAFCGPDGVIHFGASTPKYSVEILRGPECRVRRYIDIVARHGFGKGVLLVPGMQEAEDESLAREQLRKFIAMASTNAGAACFKWNHAAEVTQ